MNTHFDLWRWNSQSKSAKGDPRWRIAGVLLVILVTVVFPRPTKATLVTLRLVDQVGAPVAGSQFFIAGQLVSQDGSVSVSDGIHQLVVKPAINGQAGDFLTRNDTVQVGTSDTLVTRTWRYATLRLRLDDQTGASIAGSLFEVPASVSFRLSVANGDSVRLPVTEDPNAPAPTGALGNGYDLMVYPGFNGVQQNSNYLTRSEQAQELSVTGATRTFIWKLAALRLNLLDQNGVPIAGSKFAVPASPPFHFTVTNGDSISLPVTDDPTAQPSGQLSGGYDLTAYPGFNGVQQGSNYLIRSEQAQELPVTGAVRTFTWKLANLRLNLVDQSGVPIAGSKFEVPAASPFHFFVANGDSTILPVTEDPSAPAATGPLGNGYDLILYPGFNGVQQGSNYLIRAEQAQELSVIGAMRTFTWRMCAGMIQVLSSAGSEAPGSAIFFDVIGAVPTGTYRSLPVTNDPTQTSAGGQFSSGYECTIRPSLSAGAAGPFSLRLLAGRVFSPDSVMISGQSYHVRFEPGPPQVTSVVPVAGGSGGNAGAVTITAVGSNLLPRATLKLSRAGQVDIQGTQLVANGTTLRGVFDLRTALLGPWDVVAVNPDSQSATLPGSFTIEAGEVPQLRVAVVGPDTIRAGFVTAFDLVLENQGNVDALTVPLWIAGVPTGSAVELEFPVTGPPRAAGEPNWNTAPLTFESAEGSYLALVIPHVPPGTLTRRFFLTVPASEPTFQLVAAVTPPWVDGAAFRACLTSGGVVQNPSCLGSQLTAINSLVASSPQVAAVNGIGLWAKLGWQCEGATTPPAAYARAEQVLEYMLGPVEAETTAPECSNVLLPRWRQALAVHVGSTIDPSAKEGPAGTVSGQQAFPYTIHFENQSTATLPVRQVRVVDPLSTSLDLNTVSLGEIAFGDRRIFPPPGLQDYATEVALGSGSLIVRVGVTLDHVTRSLTWLLTCIDSHTGQPPLNPLLGFLAPAGQGSVQFTVRPASASTHGSQIVNGASVTFDSNPVENPPAVENILDRVPPASHVIPLMSPRVAPSFVVNWMAEGAPSDLRDFTIYVSEDGGPYEGWQQNTISTSGVYTPRPGGHTYSFYSVARDLSGNVEAAPAASDAQTAVDAGEPRVWQLALAGGRPNPSVGVLQIAFTLPGKDRGQVELFDVAGHRVFKQDIGELGPGPYTLTVNTRTRLASGIYFARLKHGERTMRSRIVFFR